MATRPLRAIQKIRDTLGRGRGVATVSPNNIRAREGLPKKSRVAFFGLFTRTIISRFELFLGGKDTFLKPLKTCFLGKLLMSRHSLAVQVSPKCHQMINEGGGV